MKRKNYRYLTAAIVFVLTYFLLLVLLVICERGYPDSHIRTLADAFWFSLVTLSTVGYGDLTPVSPMGHVIGGIFLIMSMGLLVALVGSCRNRIRWLRTY